MKQRIKIKQAKKELNQTMSFVTSSFNWDLKHFKLDDTTLKIWDEYFLDLKIISKILKNKQLHIIQKIKSNCDLLVVSFSDLLEDMDAMFEIAFDDKEIYNFSDLLRKPIYKPVKQNKRKKYEKAFKHILSVYKKRINKISDTIAYKELKIDIDNISKLIQQNRIKELNIILSDTPFNAFVEDLIHWYLYDFDDKYNLVVYDYDLHQIK